MKTKHLLALLLLCCLPVSQVQAQTTDPLWQKALAHMEAIKSLVASQLQFRLEATDGDGKVQERVDTTSQLSGWKAGEPVRVVSTSSDPKQNKAADSKSDLTLANHPNEALKWIASVQRKDEVMLGAQPSVVFEVSGEKLKNDKKLPFTGKVWLDKTTGSVLKTDYSFDPANVPMTKKMSQLVVFGANKDGVWLPKTSTADATVSAFFMLIKINMQYSFESWVARPQ
jgi:hypothetical protein